MKFIQATMLIALVGSFSSAFADSNCPFLQREAKSPGLTEQSDAAATKDASAVIFGNAPAPTPPVQSTDTGAQHDG